MAAQLAGQADQVAALTPGTCAARDAAERFRAEVIASIAQVPARYREPLMSAANSLAERLARCSRPQPSEDEHGTGGKHKGKKKHHDEGDEGHD